MHVLAGMFSFLSDRCAISRWMQSKTKLVVVLSSHAQCLEDLLRCKGRRVKQIQRKKSDPRSLEVGDDDGAVALAVSLRMVDETSRSEREHERTTANPVQRQNGHKARYPHAEHGTGQCCVACVTPYMFCDATPKRSNRTGGTMALEMRLVLLPKEE